MEWFAFVTLDGRVAGVVPERKKARSSVGCALAVLETPCSLPEWNDLLKEEENLDSAVEALIKAHGGARIKKLIPIPEAVWVPLAKVGEA